MTELSTITSDAADPLAVNSPPDALALVIAWARTEPDRVGEVAVAAPTRGPSEAVLGRGPAAANDPERRLEFARHRAGIFEVRSPLRSPTLSRQQLRVRANGVASLSVENVGRSRILHNGAAVASAEVFPGDTLRIGPDLLLLCVRRPAWLPGAGEAPAMPFGLADPVGWVGESPVAWEHRRQLALVASTDEHVLVIGESGTGKEHAACAVHALSARAAMPFVARSAATLPGSLMDAELFGHARNYPNFGMPERVGVIGHAAGGTLFLDELAELPHALQAHLLRVLDAGEYHRLGESVARVATFRLVAATNHPNQLRPELAARLKVRIRLPGLNERAEDVPLLVLHLLRKIAAGSPEFAARFFPKGDPHAVPRVSVRLIDQLVRRQYTTHVRELERALWTAFTESRGDFLDAPAATPDDVPVPAPLVSPRTSPRDVTAVAIASALAANDGNIEQTWRALGLASRHVLTRLITKHGLRRTGASS